jgi:hypothetical protein
MQKYLCMPALLYAIFSLVQIIFDLFGEMYTVAFTKIFIAVIFTFFLNMLCAKGLSVISWILVIIPFIFTLLLFEILIFILAVTKDFDKEINEQGIPLANPNSLQYIDVSYSEAPLDANANANANIDTEDYNNLETAELEALNIDMQ